MPKIIIYDKKNILIAELEGKIKTESDLKVAKFKSYKLMESQTIKKHIKRIEAAIKYTREEQK